MSAPRNICPRCGAPYANHPGCLQRNGAVEEGEIIVDCVHDAEVWFLVLDDAGKPNIPTEDGDARWLALCGKCVLKAKKRRQLPVARASGHWRADKRIELPLYYGLGGGAPAPKSEKARP